MAQPVIYDTCLLSHVAEIGYLHILDFLYKDRPEPRWTPAVKREVTKGAAIHVFCKQILALTWLGEPQEPQDTNAVLHLRNQLSSQDDPQTANMGEAESIILAREVNGSFMTNDFGAYYRAGEKQYLAPNRVFSACNALNEAREYGKLSPIEVEEAHNLIRAKRRMICDCRLKLP